MKIKLSDAYTREELGAAIDARLGGKSLDASLDKWKDVDGIMQYWSKLIAYRICEAQRKMGCLKPEA